MAFGSSGGHRTTTDNEGLFKVPGLDAGMYRVFLSAPGYVVQIPTDSTPTYRPGDRAELTLIKGAVIAGNITNIAGEPVVNISVRAYQIRDTEGNKIASAAFSQPKFTDDRGLLSHLWITAGHVHSCRRWSGANISDREFFR